MRNFICWRFWVVFMTLPVIAGGAIQMSLDNEEGVYGKGETARVTILLSSDIVETEGWRGEVSWQRSWSGRWEKSDLPAFGEPFELTFAGEEPGLIVVRVLLEKKGNSEASHAESIGLLFQPEEILLSTAEAADFDAFWAERKAYWRTLPEEVGLTPVDSADPEIKIRDVTITMKGETPVSGYLAYQVNAKEGSLPGILTLHGAGFRSANAGGVTRLAKEGFLAMDINAHGLPNGKPDSFYVEAGREIGNDFRSRGMQSREDWYFHGMYLRVVTALDFLAERSEWNGEDLVLRGSSQGGAQVFGGAGLDDRVTVIAASVPAMCDLSGVLAGRRGGWPRPVPANLEGSEEARQIHEVFGYYDSGLFAKRIEAAAIVSLGLVDPTCPADGIQASINNLQGEVIPLYRPRMAHAIPHEINLAFDEFIQARVSLPQ